MDELKRNGSGYVDPTAYEALKKIQQGEEKKMMNRGEIWWANFGGVEKMLVVVTAYDRCCSMLVLSNENKGNYTKEVTSQGGMTFYVNPKLMSYKFEMDLISQADRLTTDSMSDLLDTVADTLELSPYCSTPLSEKITKPEIVNRPTKEEMDYIQTLENEVFKLRTERDLYQTEYRNLLAQMMRR